MFLLPLLFALGSFATPAPQVADSVRVQGDQTFLLESGARVHLYRSGWSWGEPGAPLTLRLFVPLGESPEEAGAGQILRLEAEARMRQLASRYGIEVQVERTSEGLAYWASGPTRELDTMIWAFNEGMRAPDPLEFPALRRSQLAVVLRSEETPEGALAARLRTRLGATRPPLRGTRAALEAMEASQVSAVWARSHAQQGLQVVAVGDIAAATLLGALSDLKLPTQAPMVQQPPAPPLSAPGGAPETIRFWMAEAWPIDRVRDPRALVAVRLLGDAARMRSQQGELDMGAELWEVDGRWHLVLSGATYPARARSLQPSLESLVPEVQANLDPHEIRREALRIQRDLRHQAATPHGMARLVGEALETGGDPDFLPSLLRELEILEITDMVRFFTRLREASPVREEIRP